MSLVIRQGRMPLLAAVVIVAAFAAGALAQEAQPGGTVPVYEPKPAAAPTVPKIAVYITGNAPEDKKKAVGTRLLVALVKTGRYASIERPAEFAEAAESVRASAQGAASAEEYIYELGKTYGVKYVCIAEVTAQADDYQILARVINVKTAQVAAIGDFYGPIKTAVDLKPALDELVETMFAKPKNAAAAPQPAPPSQSGATAEAASAAAVPADAASTPAVTVTGPAKDAVEKVIAAVNALKDAMAKSVAAANAVATAAQSKNFSAIMAAKKSVESAAAAVKKAKEDGLAAVEALKAAGPEAEEAARAMGINLAMFTGGGEDGKKTDFYFAPKYQLPVGTPVSWGGVNAEIGWIWGNGVFFGIDANFGSDGDGVLAGLGLSLGGTFGRDQVQFSYGGSAGFWFAHDLWSGYSTSSYNFLAPFVKLRLSVFELTYRGLLGVYDEYYDDGWSHGSGGGFGYNSHQLMLGFHFASSKRAKPSKSRPAGESSYSVSAPAETPAPVIASAAPPVGGSAPATELKYRTVTIGGKTWMAENMNDIPARGGSWCYDGIEGNCGKYGRLYDWNAAMAVCPAGWRLPTRDDWNELTAAVDGSPQARGFPFMAGGTRKSDGSFSDVGKKSRYWTATEYGGNRAYNGYMSGKSMDESNYNKGFGFSVRCVAD